MLKKADLRQQEINNSSAKQNFFEWEAEKEKYTQIINLFDGKPVKSNKLGAKLRGTGAPAYLVTKRRKR